MEKRRKFFWENLVNSSVSYAEIVEKRNHPEIEQPKTERLVSKSEAKTRDLFNEIFRPTRIHDQPNKDIFHDQLDKLVAND